MISGWGRGVIILSLPPHTSASNAIVKLHWKLGRRAEHCAIFVFKLVNNL